MKITTPTLDAMKRELPTLSEDGLQLNRNAHELDPGDVVTVEGATGYYLLCQESRHNPRGADTGELRHFLVNLTTGGRLIQGGVLTLRKFDTELCVKGWA